MLLGHALETGEVVAPEDGPVSWTDHADLAEAAAIALTEDGLDGPTPVLTGSEAVDLAGLAAIASEVGGRRIRRTVVTDARYREHLVGNGVPEPAAEMLVGLFAASRRGEFAAVDPTLGRLLGRPSLTVRDVLKS
jgi:NAD(P)H dehydrogenase (quinone)